MDHARDYDNIIHFDRDLDHARELEREQVRLARRVAELEAEMQQRVADLERRVVGERAVQGTG